MSAPSTYNQTIADKICDEIASSSKGIARLCFENQTDGWPSSRTIYRWLNDHEEFRHQYARAKEEQAHRLVEEMIAIADDTSHDVLREKLLPTADTETYVNSKGEEKTRPVFIKVKEMNSEFVASKKLMIDVRKWVVSKLLPKVYGDHQAAIEDSKFEIIVTEEILELPA